MAEEESGNEGSPDESALRAELAAAQKAKSDAEEDARKARAEAAEASRRERAATALADEAKAAANEAKAEADEAKAVANRAESEADDANEEAKKAKADASEARVAADAANEARAHAETAATDAKVGKSVAEALNEGLVADRDRAIEERKSAIRERDSAQKMVQASAESTVAQQPKLGVEQFVTQSLLDIMAGVDNAAAIGKTKAMKDGLDGLLHSVTTIGASTAEGRTSDRVQFDLAVTIAKSEEDGTKWGIEVEAGAQARLLGMLKLQGKLAAQYDHETSEASSHQQANRIQFSVPIVYAVQESWANED